MNFGEIQNATQPYTQAAGLGTILGLATHQAIAFGRGVMRGTTYALQRSNVQNIAFGASVGVLAACVSYAHYAEKAANDVHSRPLEYLGASALGALAGAFIRPLRFASRNQAAGITDNLGTRAREGAFRGAIADPIAYGLADAITTLIPRL